MKRYTYYILLCLLTAVCLGSCTSSGEKRVRIDGVVADADGQQLLLYRLEGRPVLADSLTLKADGVFSFKPQVEATGYDYFCLMLNGQSISLVADTLQSPIHVTAKAATFGTSYVVEDSLNMRLQEAVALGNTLRRNLMQSSAGDARQLVLDYKDALLRNYIYRDPTDPVSYYLLFETVSGLSVFDPYDAKDLRAYGAVANLWNVLFPASSRTEKLVSVVKQSMYAHQQARQNVAAQDSILQQTTILTSNFPNLALTDVSDHVVNLTDVAAEGYVTVLDYTAYFMPQSPEHNAMLSALYDRYKDRGLRIYQVSVDPDENFWKVSASKLPWTAVRDREVIYDPQGMVQYSAAASTFNVTTVPTMFVIDRHQQVVSRVDDDDKLAGEVAKVL